VSTKVLDGPGARRPVAEEAPAAEKEEEFYYASQWDLMWWRFRQHRLALISAVLLLVLYLVAIFAEFFMPYDAWNRFPDAAQAPPTKIHFTTPDGRLTGPYVYRVERRVDPETYRWTYVEVEDVMYPVGFFVRGHSYKLLGLIPADIHLFGVGGDAGIWLFGNDLLGYDVFSRTLFGARVSLFIGLIGVVLTFFFGILIGGVAGYAGGVVDWVLERVNELLRTVPTIPLLVMLSGVIPKTWPIYQTYFVMTVILSFVGWVGLARVVRGRLLSMREEDSALAAKVAGCSDLRIIFRHLLPGFMSHLIASLTLAIPSMILGETALSYLGLGLYRPAVSWGVMLADTRNIQAIANLPWMLIPALWVLATVLLFNFFGDGLRDAADPHRM
jgi:peptide/nickel transport system permease protein